MPAMSRLRALPIFPLLLFVGLTPAQAQSFNCRYAKTADEVLICQDARLAALDERLATVYARLRQQLFGAQRKRLEQSQALWLKQRRDCGRDVACITQLYEERVQALTAQAALPKQVGECVVTSIAKIGDRFGAPIGATARENQMGSAVGYANGGYQVSYDWVAALAHSRVGDRVRMCLVSIPQDCPPGDDRGRYYKTTNLRNRESWELPDAQHMCGGA
jgi:uncharacterized protein